jgi:WhiB family redox-sensing transcriptional regulator
MATAPSFDGTQPCLKVDPELFFPELPARATAADKREYAITVSAAKAVCTSCPFVDACLTYALYNDVTGVWGATIDSDRRAIRKQKKIPPPKPMSVITAQWTK